VRRAALLALALLAAAPAAASAHAQLEGTVPARGATVREPPAQVVFRFDEPVEGNFGAVRVFDARGRRVDDGRVGHPGGHGPQIAVGLKPGLPQGAYTATYRVISADGHPVSGGMVFNVGRASAAPPETVAQLLGGGGSGKATGIAFGVARGADYLATALVLGTLAFLLAVWLPALRAAAGGQARWRAASEAAAGRARALLAVAVALGVLSGLAGIVLEGATAAGVSFWTALDPSTVREVLGTRFGTVWGLRVLDWALLGLALSVVVVRGGLPSLRPAALGATGLALGASRLLALAIPALFVAVAPALAGHASTQSPTGLLIPLDIAHVAAMSAWLGGLVALLALVPAATRRLEAPERTRLLAGVLVRFSPIALGAVCVLLVSGVVQAYVHVRHLDALTATAFGRAVLIKAGLAVVLVALGAVNRRRVVPGLRRLAATGQAPGGPGSLLRRTVRAEIALIVVVLGVTSALVSYAPPTSLASGPYSTDTRMGPLQLELTADATTLHLYLFDARTGAQFTGTKELTVRATLPAKGIGPLPVRMRQAGPGHYISDGLALAPNGKWSFVITDRVSAFDEYSKRLEVPVR
jgi:copper transport protein